MNILLISQCSKKALTESRRILDQFAERRGDRSWQTPITQQGLQTLHKLLRKTARKNTAVACHWIRSKDHSELLWIVGDASQFNAQGATPTNITRRDILRSQDENDWHSAEDIRLLAAMAALFHDFGKANAAFQAKLKARPGQAIADAYRHEWISLRLFAAFVGQDDDAAWLQRLIDDDGTVGENCLQQLACDGLGKAVPSPFGSIRQKTQLPPLAETIGWLIVSHHRLPTQAYDAPLRRNDLENLPRGIAADWCGTRRDAEPKEIAACWQLDAHTLPFASRHWRQHAARLAKAMLARKSLLGERRSADPYQTHLARLALMLADHYYSSQPSHARYGDSDYPLYANTDRDTGQHKQRLDEHLIGVEVNASRIVQALPRLARQLPRIARHKGFRQRSSDPRFRWQDKAFDLAESLQARSAEQGFFGINMASTGFGKTLANGRILYGLANPQLGARFTIALGLRTLTLQTGDAYREKLKLGEEDLAVLVGGGAIRQLHQQRQEEDAEQQATGSESSADLLPPQHYVHFAGSLEDGPLNRWLGNNQDAQRLLNAPILACTIDHLMPACESGRGGHQIAPMLRLLSADLVLDEADDFDLADLPALSRLVHWAGLLGSRVLLSSATLPPALVEALFLAYRAGRQSFAANRGIPGQSPDICCAWFDEFSCAGSDHQEADSYLAAHQAFVDQRLKKLATAESRRLAQIIPVDIARQQERPAICQALASLLHDRIGELHRQHGVTDPESGKRLSVGLIRFANIEPLIETAQALAAHGSPAGQRLHLCVYHAQHPLLVRSAIERRLDRLLKRTAPAGSADEVIFSQPDARELLDWHPEQEQILVVLATPVAEVGRDHDYDWAIVEPSSMRSIIQLAGRIRRHRPGPCRAANLDLLDTNIRHLRLGNSEPAFCRPGFESRDFPLSRHTLSELLAPEQLAQLNAAPRIKERLDARPGDNLIDLEHAHLRARLLGNGAGEKLLIKPANWWWQTPASLSGEMQRVTPFRDDPRGRQRYYLGPDENGDIRFYLLDQSTGNSILVGHLLHPCEAQPGPRISFWGSPDYTAALAELAEIFDLENDTCARRFGYLDLPAKGCENGWHYHSSLGFWRNA